MSRTINDRVVHRKRTKLDLSVLHCEISKESHDLLREMARVKRMPVGGYLDVMLRRKKEKLVALGFIQNADSTCAD